MKRKNVARERVYSCSQKIRVLPWKIVARDRVYNYSLELRVLPRPKTSNPSEEMKSWPSSNVLSYFCGKLRVAERLYEEVSRPMG